MGLEITASIVAYKTDRGILAEAINSFLNTELPVQLFLVDNSPSNELSDISSDGRVRYVPNHGNPGFGAGHNKAIDLARSAGSTFHFIINPDIYYKEDVITPMVHYMREHGDVGMMMPRILHPDGSIQYLPKLLPNPFWLLRRKLRWPAGGHQKFINKYELRGFPGEMICNVPILSGCFCLLNMDAIARVGNYDDRFFMYFEDFDLSRRMHAQYQTVYFPRVSVYHNYESGANRSLKLAKVFISSAIYYFSKWGWFFDRQRKTMNEKVLNQRD